MTPPTAEGGALRAQSTRRPPGEPRLLNGSILRVDPATGAGVPGNPFFGSTDPNAQRIIAYGVRNPFRIDVRPGTNDVWISDVGYNAWEEINRLPDPTAAPELRLALLRGQRPRGRLRRRRSQHLHGPVRRGDRNRCRS